MSGNETLLEVSALTVRMGSVRLVEGIDFHVGSGEIVSIVGESGSGKSVTALAVMGLLGEAMIFERGSVQLEGRELVDLPDEALRAVRGKEMAMIFQEPMSSLNPVFTIGFQIAEVLQEHFGASRRESRAEAVRLLELVGIPAATERVSSYPHQLSGGMLQRAMIAMAMACRPKLLIADEPTTALDVTTQAQILELMRDLRDGFGTSILLITHDMGVVASMANRVLVMYAGQFVEAGTVKSIFTAPRHPYTRRLLECAPTVSFRRERLPAIEGAAPRPQAYPTGCRFHPRCPEVMERCAGEAPAFEDHVRCWLYRERE